MREGSLIHMEYVFLNASGEEAALQKEACPWSTALSRGTCGKRACRVSLRCRRTVLFGVPENNLAAFPSGYLMQVLLSFLKRLIFGRPWLHRPTAKQRYANGLKSCQDSDKSRHVTERHPLILFRAMVLETSTIGQVRTPRAQLHSVHVVWSLNPNMCLRPLACTTCFVFDEQTLHTRQCSNSA